MLKKLMEDLYAKQLKCGLCEHGFTSHLVRRSAQQAADSDSDFRIQYKRETPYFYSVFLCPSCGYAFLESFKKPREKQREKIHEKIRPLPDFFGEKRDAATAELAYKRAIECARLQGEDYIVMASLYLHLAWIHRVRQNAKGEQEALEESLNYYVAVYEKSELSDATKVMYLIGELNRRLGREKDAVFWFSRVVNEDHTNIAMRRMARQAWQQLREG